MPYKIQHDRPNCIGCGACAAINPEDWEMDADGKSNLIGAKKVGAMEEKEVENIGANKDAAEACPVNVIHIINEKGEKII